MGDLIADAWHLYRIRQTLLTSEWLSLCPDPGLGALRLGALRSATASLLLINLVSLLDEAMEIRMSPEDYARCRKLENRLRHLGARNDLQDLDALMRINKRRNEIGHELGMEASVAELDEATALVEAQLVAWSLVTASERYQLAAERTAIRAGSEPGVDQERDYYIRVMKGGRVVAEVKQRERFFGASGDAGT